MCYHSVEVGKASHGSKENHVFNHPHQTGLSLL